METQLLLSSQLAIGEFLARWSRKEPSREAVIYLEKRFTYRTQVHIKRAVCEKLIPTSSGTAILTCNSKEAEE